MCSHPQLVKAGMGSEARASWQVSQWSSVRMAIIPMPETTESLDLGTLVDLAVLLCSSSGPAQLTYITHPSFRKTRFFFFFFASLQKCIE